MIVVCAKCGAELRAGERCEGCAPRSRLLDVAMTAHALCGKVDAESLSQAARALREEPS